MSAFGPLRDLGFLKINRFGYEGVSDLGESK